MRSRSRQIGYMLFVVVVVLMSMSLTTLMLQAAQLLDAKRKTVSATQDSLTTISKALIQFSSLKHRLPCPANPALDAFDVAVPYAGFPNADTSATFDTAVPTCAFQIGVVPWRALGLKPDEVVDEWGRMISYRVYDGVFGLTQSEGASALLCDKTNAPLNDETMPVPLTGACNSDTNTLEGSFFTHANFTSAPTPGTKGLMINEFGNVKTGVAYVLISHGPTGLGAYLPTGTRMSLPASGATDFANTQLPADAAFTYQKLLPSSPEVLAGTAGHFDDLVSYLKLTDLVSLSKLSARDWPERDPISGFDATTTANMTTSGTSHFLTAGQTGAREFQQALGGTAVSFGSVSGTYSSCLWWPNVIEVYRPDSATLASGTSWTSAAGGTVTFVTAANHNFSSGATVVVSNANPSDYNGTYTIASTPTGTSFTASNVGSRGTVSSATWSAGTGGVVTFVTSADHGLTQGESVTVSGASPGGYNGDFVVQTVISSTSFSAILATDPGTYTSGGAIAISPGTWVSSGVVAPTIVTGTNWSSASGGTIRFFTSTRHNLLAGQRVSVIGTSPALYNGNFTILSVPSSSSFTVASATDPGTWSAGGQLVPGFRKSMMVSVEVALNSLTGSSDAGGGVVFGLLPHFSSLATPFAVSNTTCGSGTSSSRIAWDNSSDGNLPSPRFGVELDMQYNSSRSDPNNETHAAVDFAGVTHGSTAVSCSSTASTYRATGGRNGCYTGTSDQWLMNGLTSFHKVRAEIEPMSASCSGTSPLLKLWIIPSSACTGGSPPAECTSITNNDAAFAPSSLPAGSVALTQCIPTPTPSSAYDQLYFGFTSNNNNNRSTNSTENLRLTNLHSGLF